MGLIEMLFSWAILMIYLMLKSGFQITPVMDTLLLAYSPQKMIMEIGTVYLGWVSIKGWNLTF